jgi:hypothetical protein
MNGIAFVKAATRSAVPVADDQPLPVTSAALSSATATIAASASLSGAVDCTAGRAVGVITPADLKGITILSAQASYGGSTYQTLCNLDGSEWNISVSVSSFIPLDFSLFGPVNYIKLRGGTAGTPQTATATDLVLTVVKAP